MRKIISPNKSSRYGKKIDGLIIHTTSGTYNGTIQWFQNPKSKVSAHYVVSLNGEVTKMVNETEAAWHVGRSYKPTSKVYKGFNANFNTIGIECVDNKQPHSIDRTKQYPTVIQLVKEICDRHKIPIDRDHIAGHREIYAKKTCPGNVDVDYIVSKAKGVHMGLNPTDDIPTDIENELGLKKRKWYDKHWSWRQMFDWFTRTDKEVDDLKNNNKNLKIENDMVYKDLKLARQVEQNLRVQLAEMRSKAIEANERSLHLDLEVKRLRKQLGANTANLVSSREAIAIIMKKIIKLVIGLYAKIQGRWKRK